MKQYVIIGNGTAAVGCIEGIRSADAVSPITVVSREAHPVYCRPLISYYLEGKTDLEKMKYRPDDFYEKNGCQVLYGKTAVGIDEKKQLVTLDDGTALPYDALCVADGSSPFVPPFEGLEKVKNAFSFMTLDDMLALEEAIRENARVLIVGAGLIGLKCAEGLCGRVGSITVCDLAPRILSSILDDVCAARMQFHLEAHGIRFLLGDSAARFEENTAYMKSGEAVPFDILVLAVGVRPNVSLIKDIGGAVNRGIRVNDRMETSIAGIYSAGDCTEGFDSSLGADRVLAILPNAYMQGHCAGVNMAGGSETFSNAIPMNAIGFFGFHALTAGSYFTKEEGGEMYEEVTPTGIRRLFVKDGRLTGFILIGDTARAGIYTACIRNQTPLADMDYEMLKKNPMLAAFSAKYRSEKLGSVV